MYFLKPITCPVPWLFPKGCSIMVPSPLARLYPVKFVAKVFEHRKLFKETAPKLPEARSSMRNRCRAIEIKPVENLPQQFAKCPLFIVFDALFFLKPWNDESFLWESNNSSDCFVSNLSKSLMIGSPWSVCLLPFKFLGASCLGWLSPGLHERQHLEVASSSPDWRCLEWCRALGRVPVRERVEAA